MAGPVPAIHVLRDRSKNVDARHKAGHDGLLRRHPTSPDAWWHDDHWGCDWPGGTRGLARTGGGGSGLGAAAGG